MFSALSVFISDVQHLQLFDIGNLFWIHALCWRCERIGKFTGMGECDQRSGILCRVTLFPTPLPTSVLPKSQMCLSILHSLMFGPITHRRCGIIWKYASSSISFLPLNHWCPLQSVTATETSILSPHLGHLQPRRTRAVSTNFVPSVLPVEGKLDRS